MNKPIRTLSVFCLVMFLALMANVTYLQYWRADSLNDDGRNRRAVDASFSQPRGAILVGREPVAESEPSDDRYEFLLKLQGILQTLGYRGIIVLVDRIDEPHLINGSAELMKALLWPMLDNKFLKHPGLGIKLMLPLELTRFIEREERDFYQRARLDKQNMVPSFEWTGEALFDVASARVRACAAEAENPNLRDLFDPKRETAKL